MATSRSRPGSLRRVVAWACVGPFLALAGLLVAVLTFAALAMIVRIVLTLTT